MGISLAISTQRSKTAQLQPAADMAYRKSQMRKLTPDSGLWKLLQSKPKLAEGFGHMLESARKNFGTAYPGQTRDSIYTIQQWEEAGHHDIAEISRLMGLKGM